MTQCFGLELTFFLECFGERQKTVCRKLFKSYNEAENYAPQAIESLKEKLKEKDNPLLGLDNKFAVDFKVLDFELDFL